MWPISGNPDIDKLIKDSMCKPAGYNEEYDKGYSYLFLEWVTFDRFTDIKEIGEGGFANVYSATWIDGKSRYLGNIMMNLWRKLHWKG